MLCSLKEHPLQKRMEGVKVQDALPGLALLLPGPCSPSILYWYKGAFIIYLLHMQHQYLKARVLNFILNLKVVPGSVAESLRSIELGNVNAIGWMRCQQYSSQNIFYNPWFYWQETMVTSDCMSE